MQRKSSLTRQRGVTLIEMCATAAIACALAGTAVPSFKDSNNKRALDGSADELATDLQFARGEAVARQVGVRVSFHAVASGSCMLIHTGATADCACDQGGATRCTSGATLIKGTYFAGSRSVGVTANVDSMRFDPVHGAATPAGTVRINTASGPSVHHVVNIMGRVRTCSPGGTAKGYKAC